MPTTFVHGLLPTSCVGVSYRSLPPLTRGEWVRLFIACFILGNLPDIDLLPAIVQPRLWHSLHRYAGHNVFALTIWIALGYYLIRHWVSPSFEKRRAWILSACLVLSHVLLDAMCDGALEGRPRGSGVPLLWPFTQWQFVLPFHPFPGVAFSRGTHPFLELLFSPDYWKRVAFVELGYSVFFLALWSAFWGSLRLVRGRLPKKKVAVTATETSSP